jgi:hypothetical protein
MRNDLSLEKMMFVCLFLFALFIYALPGCSLLAMDGRSLMTVELGGKCYD